MLQFIVGVCVAAIFCITYYERKLTSLQLDRLEQIEGRLALVEDELVLTLEPIDDEFNTSLKILKDNGLLADDTEIRTEGIVIPLERKPEWIG